MEKKLLVFQSDFGLVDGAVAAMYGVSKMVDSKLEIFNLTHDISQFNIWEASYRLFQTIKYWPSETVFVSVVDPGVGSNRRSIVARTKDDKYIISPDNGTLTHILKYWGVVEVRVIDESINRLPDSQKSHTFHGRDIYAYTGARLASNTINYEQVGPQISIDEIVELELGSFSYEKNKLEGSIDILDKRYGSLWTNIPEDYLEKANIKFGDKLMVTITKGDRTYYNNIVKFDVSFAQVNIGEPIVYIDSVLTVGLAINQGNFAKAYNIGTGIEWKIKLEKMEV